MKYLRIFISSFLAGCCIVFGATCYLICASQGTFGLKLAGSFMFGIGLFTIIHFKLWLYTGKVGYAFDNKASYILELLTCLAGNLIGVFALSSLLKATYIINDSVILLCQSLISKKQSESWIEVLILGVMCGVMIYLAVEGHKKVEYPLGKVLFAFMPISLFILCGFEHVVANACYYTYAGVFNGKVILWFLLMAIGDGIGSIAFDGIIKLIKYLENEEAK